MKFIMMCGIPGAGKTTLAYDILADLEFDGEKATLLSSDEIREELYGNASFQGNPKQVFGLMEKRTLDALNKGCSVIYDATNIKKNDRMRILDKVKEFDCETFCCVVECNVETAVERRQRSTVRNVPEAVIRRMASQFAMPEEDEGWDNINHYFYCLEFSEEG